MKKEKKVDEQYYATAEILSRFKGIISGAKLRTLVKNGEIKPIKKGRSNSYSIQAIQDIVNNSTPKPAKPKVSLLTHLIDESIQRSNRYPGQTRKSYRKFKNFWEKSNNPMKLVQVGEPKKKRGKNVKPRTTIPIPEWNLNIAEKLWLPESNVLVESELDSKENREKDR